jgi:DMSO/TMAO reductase YedYZ molybdopterin-dependent catalytic subunit
MSATRRSWLTAMVAGAGGAVVAGCNKISEAPATTRMLLVAEKWNKGAHRALMAGRTALAPEYGEEHISKYFKPNGSISPGDPDYRATLMNHFTDWRLVIDGLVENPLSLSLTDLRAEPSRTQITRHDCVEGWSSIAKWKGAKLTALLDKAKIKKEARFLVFHCMDSLEEGPMGQYYESMDMVDAHHPQTILAYEMNGKALPVAHGAPLRLRIERQLGYKNAKYLKRIEAVADFSQIKGGRGGFWEDRGYEWYAGI